MNTIGKCLVLTMLIAVVSPSGSPALAAVDSGGSDDSNSWRNILADLDNIYTVHAVRSIRDEAMPLYLMYYEKSNLQKDWKIRKMFRQAGNAELKKAIKKLINFNNTAVGIDKDECILAIAELSSKAVQRQL